jgi:hypothetical protein
MKGAVGGGKIIHLSVVQTLLVSVSVCFKLGALFLDFVVILFKKSMIHAKVCANLEL